MNNFAQWFLNSIVDPVVSWLVPWLDYFCKLPKYVYTAGAFVFSVWMIYIGVVQVELAKVITATESIPSIVSSIHTQGHSGDLTSVETDVSDFLAAINTFFPLDELFAMMVVLFNLYVVLIAIRAAVWVIQHVRLVLVLLEAFA